jgi:pimeloyl-ACP methyl ester carboxylesterase
MSTLLAVDELGHGEPLVLLHGLGATRAIWTTVAPVLARRRRVVTVDVPGFGESEPAGPGFELEAVADRIARGLAARGVGVPFDLLGHSLGAGVALTLAAARPRSVRRLVLSAPAGFATYPQPAVRVLAAGLNRMLAARRALARLTDLAWGRRLLLANVAADPRTLSPTQARFIVDASAGARRSAEALATIASADLRPLLERAPATLGLIWGEQDRTVSPRIAQVIRAVRPDAELELIARAGHVAMVERPEAYVAAVEALLTRLGNGESVGA